MIRSASFWSLFPIALACLAQPGMFSSSSAAALPDGFEDHGVAAPVGRQPFGTNTFATVDENGRRLVVSKMWTGDETSYLFIDVETGETFQIGPDIGGRGGWPVLFTGDNKLYDTLGRDFVELDVEKRELRRVGRIPSGMALAHVADGDGVVYSGIYPSATLVSFNPRTGEYRDHGRLAEESWPQYLRPLAADDHGWIYGGIGQNLAQVVSHHPATGETRRYLDEDKRTRGQGQVFRGTDGEVYGNAPGWGWHRLSGGEAFPLEGNPPVRGVTEPNNIFPDGSRFTQVDLPNRVMTIQDAGNGERREIRFEYESPGVRVYGVTAGPDGKIYGATGIPLRVWRFDPETGGMKDWGLAGHAGHVNQFAVQGGKLYGAVYSSGSLIEYDPSQPFHDAPIRNSRNPRHLHGYEFGHQGSPDMVGRPYAVLAHPDGRHVIMGGNPARVLVGGGLVIFDTESEEVTALKPDQLVPNQGVMALGALPGGDLVVGSTTMAATAGTSGASVAFVYRLDWETKEVKERWVPRDPTVRTIRDMLVGENGLVFIKASAGRFLVLDPATGEFVFDETLEDYGPLTGGQAPRTMEFGPDGWIYLLFRDAIARFHPETFAHEEVARPGLPITAGIAIHDSRIYFTSVGRLFSYRLETAVE